MEEQMKGLWTRWENWLNANTKQELYSKTLKPGASEAEIASLEEQLGVKFPQDFRHSLKIHNGQEEIGGLIGGYTLLPLDQILSEWETWRDVYEEELDDDDSEQEVGESFGPIQMDEWWHLSWIPITSNGGGDGHCLDLAPAEGGTIGQIFHFDHETRDKRWVASSFEEWMTKLIEQLENGCVQFDSDGYYQLSSENLICPTF
ncbi:uncharacterized protein VTP21DRAFT_11716 [Calcarisporiella thermophila]|uniref:uncharacterized protein n=1 Tax=Calcarisporiella thermophila TaxID=911321 RepID=UPI003743289E